MSDQMQELTEVDKLNYRIAKLEEALRAGVTMRAMQDKFFKGGRLQGDLRTAKQWESTFDHMADELLKPQPQAVQGDLFNG